MRSYFKDVGMCLLLVLAGLIMAVVRTFCLFGFHLERSTINNWTICDSCKRRWETKP